MNVSRECHSNVPDRRFAPAVGREPLAARFPARGVAPAVQPGLDVEA